MMKHLSFSLLLLFAAVCSFSQTNVGGPYFSNQHWTLAGSPYTVTSDVQIAPNYTLTIDPGVQVIFGGGNEILIKGAIQALGAPGNEIVFDGTSSTKMVHFLDANLSLSRMEHCDMSNGTAALYAGGNCSGTPNISHIAFSGCQLLMASLTGTLAIDSSTFDNTTVHSYDGGSYGVMRISDSQINNSTLRGSSGTNSPTFWLVVERSTLEDCHIDAYSGGIAGEMLYLNADTLLRTSIGSYYAKTRITNSWLDGCSFDNYHTAFLASAEHRLENCFLVNTDVLDEGTLPWVWGQTVTLVNTVVELGPTNVFWTNRCTLQNSSIIGSGAGTGVRTLSVAAQNSLIAGHAVGLRLTDSYGMNSTLLGCNFRDNSLFNVTCDSTYGADARNSWWGTADSLTIFTLIRDYYDNLQDGEVVVSPWANIPNINAPMSPPSGVSNVPGSGFRTISWNPNPEPDLLGYRLYIGVGNDYRYSQMIDLGNVTTYQIPDAQYIQGVAITAYDRVNTGLNEILLGHESPFVRINSVVTSVDPGIGLMSLDPHIGPNPTRGNLNIALDEEEGASVIELVDLQGKLLIQTRVHSQSASMDLSAFPAGTYLLTVTTESGRSAARKVNVMR